MATFYPEEDAETLPVKELDANLPEALEEALSEMLEEHKDD